MDGDLVWVTLHDRFAGDLRQEACRLVATVRHLHAMTEDEFARHLSPLVRHRQVSADHVRVWERGPVPPPGDVLWAILRMGGVDPTSHIEGGGVKGLVRSPRAAEAMEAGLARSGLRPELDWERLASVRDGGCRLDTRSLEDLAALTSTYGQLNATMAPTSLLLPVRGQHALLTHLRESAVPLPLAPRLARIAGDTCMLLGWLAFLLEDRREARHQWRHADELATELDDDRLRAHVLIAKSSLVSSLPYGGRGGESGLTLSLLDDAEARAKGHHLLSTWLKARRAEEHAAVGHGRESARDLLDAERSLAQASEHDTILPGPRTPVDLAGYRGNCAVLLGHDREASEVLQRAADEAPGTRATLRAVLLNDLGAALSRLGEVDLACAAFTQALALAGETGASVHVQRVAGTVRGLDRWRSSPAVQLLEERLLLAT